MLRKIVASGLLSLGIAFGPALSSASASTPTKEQHAVSADVVTGSKAWAVVLCQFSDTVGSQPHTVQWYRDFVTHSAPGHDGLWDYWHDVSYGKLDLNGSQVITDSSGGWNTLPHSVAYYAGLPQTSARLTLWRDCANSAGGVDYSKYYGVLAMLNAQRDSGAVATGPLSATLNGKTSAWGAVVLDPAGAQNVSWGAHETGHAFGLNHSYDTALANCTSSKTPGEYCDPYDQMGYENSWNTFQTSEFSYSAPGLTGPNLIKLGFVQPIVVDPQTGTQDIGLSPLEQSPSVIEVPAGDAPNHYYTIEYRDPTLGYASGTAWGQKLPGPGVVIHEVKTNGLSYVVDQQGGPNFGTCGVFVGAQTSNGTVRILVDSLPSPWSGTQAFVRVGSVNDGVPDPGACTAGGGATITGGGGAGGPAETCQYPNCGPKPPQCNFAGGANNPMCGVHIGYMQ
jgi:M6 family metalloprotease-like protein